MKLPILEVVVCYNDRCVKTKALFDSGSSESIIPIDIAEEIECLRELEPTTPKYLRSIDERELKVSYICDATIMIDDLEMEETFLVAEWTSGVIIGVKTMDKWGVELLEEGIRIGKAK